MARSKIKRTSKPDTKTCPKCGASVASVILLCECGYHFQTNRVVSTRRDGENPDSAILLREEDGALRYRWLARSATLFVVLAYFSLVATLLQVYAAIVAFNAVIAPAGSAAALIATIDLIRNLVVVCFLGATCFITLRALSDAARLLLANAGGIMRLLEEEP